MERAWTGGWAARSFAACLNAAFPCSRSFQAELPHPPAVADVEDELQETLELAAACDASSPSASIRDVVRIHRLRDVFSNRPICRTGPADPEVTLAAKFVMARAAPGLTSPMPFVNPRFRNTRR